MNPEKIQGPYTLRLWRCRYETNILSWTTNQERCSYGVYLEPDAPAPLCGKPSHEYYGECEDQGLYTFEGEEVNA